MYLYYVRASSLAAKSEPPKNTFFFCTIPSKDRDDHL